MLLPLLYLLLMFQLTILENFIKMMHAIPVFMFEDLSAKERQSS